MNKVHRNKQTAEAYLPTPPFGTHYLTIYETLNLTRSFSIWIMCVQLHVCRLLEHWVH